MTGEESYPVAIVGGGPVGLTLALFLDGFGVKSIVFNSDAGTRLYPKGSTENARTMEHFRRLGISAAVRELGLPPDHPTDVAYFTRLNGPELARLRMPSEARIAARRLASPFDDQQPEPIFRANQMYIDRALLDHARTRRNITLAFGTSVTELTQTEDHVVLRTDGAGDGRPRTVRASFAVGCDGAHGVVRRSLGIAYGGHEDLRQAFHGGRMISTHIRSAALFDEILSKRLAWQYWTLNPKVRSVILSVNGKDEFALFSRPRDDEPLPDADAVRAIVRKSAGVDIPVDVIAQSPWNSGVARVAERFSEGRIFIAGDAAHLFTPTGGFGMNTGVDDAANLAWKLAGLVQGWGGPGLSASYEAERKPIADRNTTAARELARRIGGLAIPEEIEDATTGGEAARKSLGAFLAANGAQFASEGVQLGARYDGSRLVVSDAPPPPDRLEEYVPTSIPGGRAPHLWLSSGRGFGDSLFDRMGFGFALLQRGDDAGEGARLVANLASRRVPIKLLRVPEAASHLYERRYTLLRPDQHVAWRTDAPGDDAIGIASRACGW